MQLVLGSGSKYRAEILTRLGRPFVACASSVDESALPGESPETLVSRLARDKAKAVAAEYPDALIIGSDQLAIDPNDGGILGKPGTVAAACAQLARLSGQRVTFLTSLCLYRAADQAQFEGLDRTNVQFRKLTEVEIASYVAQDQPLDCAGAFKSEGLGAALFENIDTKDPNALVGLPLILLCRYLRQAGYPLLAAQD